MFLFVIPAFAGNDELAKSQAHSLRSLRGLRTLQRCSTSSAPWTVPAAELKVPVVLMHMLGEPRTMQVNPHYDDVVSDVRRFLAERIFACEMSGIDKKRIVADPGFGFGKTLEHNLALLRSLDQLAALGVPLLVGLSRKGMIGTLTGR